AHRAGHLPSMMSVGEQQRVAVARALVIKPALVLGDEPTGNLDSKSGAGVIGLFRELVDRWQHTVVVVTHEAHVSQYADRIVRLRDGVIEEDVRLRQPRVNDPPERQVNAPQDPRESDPTEPPRPLVERRLSAGAAQPTGVNEPTAAPPKQTPGK
ncbi:MAG: ABC transporter, partial [Planctomycetota bacterium]